MFLSMILPSKLANATLLWRCVDEADVLYQLHCTSNLSHNDLIIAHQYVRKNMILDTRAKGAPKGDEGLNIGMYLQDEVFWEYV